MKKILVPIDGSKGARLALEKARELGELTEAEITILNVMSNVMANPYILEQSHITEINDVFSKQAKNTIDEALEIFDGYPQEVKTEIKLGDPAHEIIEMANNEEYDLIIMGNRGLNAFSRVMMGSVSNRVVNHVKTSVFIVKG